MLLHPAVLALLFVSSLQALVAVAVVPFSLTIARHWNLGVATERQVTLEKRTRLISTLIAFLMGLQLLMLPVFVFTADRLAGLLSGAMCAVGTLNANVFGFPALTARIITFFAAAAWLALDALDTGVPTYPLTRVKYSLVLHLAPLFAAAAFLDWRYFAALEPDVITSCCARVFAPDARSLSGTLAALAPGPAAVLFFATLGAAITTSALAALRPRSTGFSTLAAVAGLAAFPSSIAGVVSFLAPAAYDDVLHHCPFCILKAEYGHQGYALYVPLFLAAAASTWLLCTAFASRVTDLQPVLAGRRRRWAAVAAAGFTLVGVAAGIIILRSHVTLFP